MMPDDATFMASTLAVAAEHLFVAIFSNEANTTKFAVNAVWTMGFPPSLRDASGPSYLCKSQRGVHRKPVPMAAIPPFARHTVSLLHRTLP
jgi:hypothetical protein